MYQLFNEFREAKDVQVRYAKADKLCENILMSGLSWDEIQKECIFPALINTDGDFDHLVEDIDNHLRLLLINENWFTNMFKGWGGGQRPDVSDPNTGQNLQNMADQQAADDEYNQQNAAFQKKHGALFDQVRKEFSGAIDQATQSLMMKFRGDPNAQNMLGALKQIGTATKNYAMKHAFNMAKKGGGKIDSAGLVSGMNDQAIDQHLQQAGLGGMKGVQHQLQQNPEETQQKLLAAAKSSQDPVVRKKLMGLLKGSGWISPSQQKRDTTDQGELDMHKQRAMDKMRDQMSSGGMLKVDDDELQQAFAQKYPHLAGDLGAYRAQRQQQAAQRAAHKKGVAGGPPVQPAMANSSTASGMRQDHAENEGDLMIESLVATYSNKPKFGLF